MLRVDGEEYADADDKGHELDDLCGSHNFWNQHGEVPHLDKGVLRGRDRLCVLFLLLVGTRWGGVCGVGVGGDGQVEIGGMGR